MSATATLTRAAIPDFEDVTPPREYAGTPSSFGDALAAFPDWSELRWLREAEGG